MRELRSQGLPPGPSEAPIAGIEPDRIYSFFVEEVQGETVLRIPSEVVSAWEERPSRPEQVAWLLAQALDLPEAWYCRWFVRDPAVLAALEARLIPPSHPEEESP